MDFATAFADFLPMLGVFLATGVFAGVLAGLLGIGGGIVIVPALHAIFLGFGQSDTDSLRLAVATSLSTIIVTSVSSARSHSRRGSLDLPTVRLLAPFLLGGAVAGTAIASTVDGAVLRAVFAVMLTLLAFRTALGPRLPQPKAPPSGGLLGGLGFLIGAAAAMMGIGGGMLSAPVFKATGLETRKAIGSAAAVGAIIAVPATLAFVVSGWAQTGLPTGSVGYVNLVAFACLAPLTALTAPIGAALSHRLPRRALELGLAGCLLFVAIRMTLGIIASD